MGVYFGCARSALTVTLLFPDLAHDQKKITKNLKDNCGCLNDFLGEISKLSHFKLFHLADFFLHH